MKCLMKLFMAIYISTNFSFAQEVLPSADDKNFEDSVAALDNAFEVNNQYKETTKQIRFFHWRNSMAVEGDSSIESLVQVQNDLIEDNEAQILERIKSFPNESASDHAVVGGGVYAAPNPFRSKIFGNTLVEFLFHERAKFLDISIFGNMVYLDKITRERLAKVNCVTPKNSSWGRNFMDNPNCRIVVAEVLKRRNIQFIKYRWGITYDDSKIFWKDATAHNCEYTSSAVLIISLNILKTVTLYKPGVTPDQYFEQQRSDSQILNSWFGSLMYCPKN